MIPLDLLKSVKTFVVHSHCPDGLASAVILDDALPDRKIVFVTYGSPELAALQPEEGMLFCDFCPPPDRALSFATLGAIVLDHHRTAKDAVRLFGHHAFGDEKEDPGVCGAVLAYRHVWLPLREAGQIEAPLDTDHQKRVEEFATLAGIRDTWQRQSSLWEVACCQAESLRFFPEGMWLGKGILRDGVAYQSRLDVGTIGFKKYGDKIKRGVDKSWRHTTTKGTRLVVLQNTAYSSDAAELIGDDADLIIGFGYIFEEGVKRLILSTRSHTTFDCSSFAKSHGGGGHTKAAGCSVIIQDQDPNPYEAIRLLVETYETTPLLEAQG